MKRQFSRSDFKTNRGRLRIDAQIETPAQARESNVWRHKQRMSFKLTCAPAWRVDFTRVNLILGAQTSVQYEIEVELDSTALCACKTRRDLDQLVMQASHVLKALDIY